MADQTVDPMDGPSAVFACPQITILKKRADFVRCSKAQRFGTKGIHLQGRKRQADEIVDGIRVGFTCSKKVGNAVARNRAKRRLRAISRVILNKHGRSGWDYVLVGRHETTATLPFAQLQSDLIRALKKVHA